MKRGNLTRSAACALLLVLAVGACSARAARVTQPGESTKALAGSQARASGASMTPSPQPSEDGNQAAMPRKCDRREIDSPSEGTPGQNYLAAAPDQNPALWGCPDLAPGNRCRVRWQAGWQLIAPFGYLQFEVWHPKAARPATTQLVAVEQVGSNNKVVFDYQVPRVSNVLFQLVLLDSAKARVASSDQYVYEVDCNRTAG